MGAATLDQSSRSHSDSDLPKGTVQAENGTALGPDWSSVSAGPRRSGRKAIASLSDKATRLPKVEGRAWDGNRAQSAGEVNRRLKRYAQLAGLDEGRIHVHVLRHSAAMLEEELGTSLTRISEVLGHADPKTTMRYLRHLRGEGDETWEGKKGILGIGEW